MLDSKAMRKMARDFYRMKESYLNFRTHMYVRYAKKTGTHTRYPNKRCAWKSSLKLMGRISTYWITVWILRDLRQENEQRSAARLKRERALNEKSACCTKKSCSASSPIKKVVRNINE